MSQQTIQAIYYGSGGSQDGAFTGKELLVIDTTTASSPTSGSTYVTKAGSLSALATWMASQMPSASSSVDGFMPHTHWSLVNSLITSSFNGSYSSLTGKPSLAAVATSGAYADISGVPGNATTSVAGLMSAADKTKLNAVPGTFAAVATSGAYADLSGTPTSLPPSGAAGGDFTGSNFPNLVLEATIGHGPAFTGAVSASTFTGSSHDYGVVGSTATLDATTYQKFITTLTDSVATTFTITLPSTPGFFAWTIKSPTSGTITAPFFPSTIIGTVNVPGALNKSRTTVFFNDGAKQHVIFSSASDY